MREVAHSENVGFADLYADTEALFAPEDQDQWTINGVHLTEDGYRRWAQILYRELYGETAPEINETFHEVFDR